ncbi:MULTISPECIES: hypothetical protein [unclassified Flavobacterium]|uniref:hypothetical protein n=1 Tax=unclassified Flavobacterium TaxID=196869 RepID=UPI0012A84494|nr:MULTISPECIES: hypothetical protein [unclassified Flavobacterium]MBF4485907.1 hypothetical protein [Flavobacterium sp. CSZ]QGK76770.1 hypothetical protein GIY83_22645 [Flavobacterium sp. SLB02]
MKAINYLNYFFVGMPILLILIGLISSAEIACCGLLSTILTGLFQLIFGIKMLIDEPQDKNLQNYINGVIFFFLLLFVNALILSWEFVYLILVTIPPILAIYFSYITFKKAHQ